MHRATNPRRFASFNPYPAPWSARSPVPFPLLLLLLIPLSFLSVSACPRQPDTSSQPDNPRRDHPRRADSSRRGPYGPAGSISHRRHRRRAHPPDEHRRRAHAPGEHGRRHRNVPHPHGDPRNASHEHGDHRNASHKHGDHRQGGHRKGGHRFRDAKRWARVFENPKRDRWQKPAAVLRLLKLQPDHIVADIGSATGYFTVRIARAVPRGHVYGFDLEPNMVRYLNARARRENLSNLTAHLAKPSGIAPPRKLDRVFTCNTYHHIRKRVVYFKKLAAHLEPGALVMVVDFKQGPLPVGPPESHRVKLATLAKELTAAGYSRVTHDRTTLPHQWVALYKR